MVVGEESVEKLHQHYRLATVIGYGMIGSLLVLAAVVETLKAIPYESPGFFSSSTLDLLRYLFFGIAVIEFFLIRFIRKMILSRGNGTRLLSREGDLVSGKAQKLFSATVVSFAFCESVAIYGLVLFILGGSSLDFYLFIFLSLGFFWFYFPRYPQWEKWVNAN